MEGGCTVRGGFVNGAGARYVGRGAYQVMYFLRATAVAAMLASVGCSAPPVEDYDSGLSDAARAVCFPSCRLGEVCAAANRCEVMVSPFRDAGVTRDRGRD